MIKNSRMCPKATAMARSNRDNPGSTHGFASVRWLGGVALAAWTFVRGFFSNGLPFDAPNRSEPCRRAA